MHHANYIFILADGVHGNDLTGYGSEETPQKKTGKGTKGIQDIAKSNDILVPQLYSKVVSKCDGNVIMSALSLECVLAITFLGSKGETADQIKKTLSLPSKKTLIQGFNNALDTLETNQKDSVTSRISNHVYTQKGYKLLSAFKKDSNKIKKGIIKETDFSNGKEAIKSINTDVEKETRGKIKDLFSADSFDATTRLVLVNALYFKGKWKTEFDKKQTKTGDFYVSSSKTVKAAMMKTKGKYSVLEPKGLEARAINLPYKGERFHMTIILPNKKNGLEKLEKDLLKFDFSKGLKFENPRTYHIQIPKFKIESRFDLVDKLQSLGITDLFDKSKADLSGFTGNKDLFGSKMIQKAFIEVNEEGSEAAAATGLVASSRSLGSQPPIFLCDHPFVFLIKDSKTELILFTGRIVDPTK